MSVVIPAHNEERVLPRLLASLADERLEIIVVANGCSDATADVARAAGVRVVELAEGSKVAALDAGDEAASVFPRAYVDADIEIDAAGLLAVAARLRDGPELVASPGLRLDLSGASWPVRAYYAVWEVSSFRRRGHIGSGVYVLSAEGRRRFGAFPPVIGDDRFVQGLFGHAERATVDDAEFVVRPPRTLRALLARGARIAAGNRQLQRAGLAGHAPTRGASLGELVGTVARRPALWGPFLIYVGVQLRTAALADRKLRISDEVWDRDETSRR
ncbi:glycosyltransferase [Pseudolysinimonas yzui]|nr:glycosyltransferase [Pseudolysinimonas yzui]